MNSLAFIVDRLEEKRYFGQRLSKADFTAATRQIASRQGLSGSYAGMFAPTALDFKRGMRVFTGESVRSAAATSHILGEECCRLLLELGIDDRMVSEALTRAENGMLERLRSAERKHAEHIGFYCCGICTVAFWRHLAAGGLDHQESRFRDGLRVLAEYRTKGNRWSRFPFFYTLLALTEMDKPEALKELRWAVPAAERSLRVPRGASGYAKRRRAVLEKVLALAG